MSWRRATEMDGAIRHDRPGVIGNAWPTDNAYSVKTGWNYNGSGPQAFGGAEKWPVVTAEVAFTEGDENLAAQFAEQLKAFVDTFFAGRVRKEKRL